MCGLKFFSTFNIYGMLMFLYKVDNILLTADC